MKDHIFLEQAKFNAHIGVTATERATAQPLIMDVRLFLDLQDAGVSDRIRDTVNYADVAAIITEMLEQEEFHLIEAVAEEIAQLLLDTFPVEGVHLRIKKPKALKNAQAGIEIYRD